jgi:hypothetical protein
MGNLKSGGPAEAKPGARGGDRWWLARQLALAICLLFTVAHLAIQLPTVARVAGTNRDLQVYYGAAQAASLRRSPYTPPGVWTLRQVPGTYLYPPPFAAALVPLGLLPRAGFYVTWYAILEASLWLFCGALVWVAIGGSLWRSAILAGPLAFSPLLAVSFSMGQADLPVFALCALALALALRGRPGPASLLLALAACAKIYPALLLLPVTRRFGWRPLLVAALAGAIAAGASALWLGPGTFRDFLADAIPVVSQGTLHRENTSLAALFSRSAVAAGLVDPSLPSPTWLRVVNTLMGFGVLAGVVVATWKLPFPTAFGWVAGLSVLAGGICWTSYWSMFLMLAAVLWRASQPQTPHLPVGARDFSLRASLALIAGMLTDPLWFKGPLCVLAVFLATSRRTRARSQ